MQLPKIRTNLIVQDLADEVLVYDLTTNKSFYLNETARTVFNACDGQKTFAELNLPDEIIHFTLDELKKQDLIQEDYASHFAGINRREVIKRVGLASIVALPVIIGLTAPKAVNAASQGSFCTASGRTCVASGATLCNGRAAGTYNYSVNVGSDSTTNGTCGGNDNVVNSSFTCPSGSIAGIDLCVANSPNPIP